MTTTFSLLTIENSEINETLIKVETMEGDSFEDWQMRANKQKQIYLAKNPRAKFVKLSFDPVREYLSI